MKQNLYYNNVQLKAELGKCLNCKTKPCMYACPVNCCPQEFIQNAIDGKFEDAVGSICKNNPMGETCGLICPDCFCMKACLRSNIDAPVNIPKIQATIMHKYHKKNYDLDIVPNAKKVAEIGRAHV